MSLISSISSRLKSFSTFIVLSSVLLLQACGGGGGGASTATSYTVGGGVSGLSGTLVLQNNYGDDITLTADGRFSFGIKLEDSIGYNVSVQAQPANPDQICTVANANGIVSGADIENISVSCENSYSISLSISGLLGSGLVLQNNSGDDLSITADGDYTFSSGVANDAAYNVNVLTQPANTNQFCSVSNSMGIIAGGNIANINITCELSYVISGAVTGLSGSGLVLQNNNGDDLVINSNGSFSFSGTLPDASSYSISVLTNPAGLSQQCMVTNNSGTISAADVSGISINCVTNSFQVGGTVSGLAGSGLMLQNTAGDSLSISANGAFSFASPITDGSNYNVSLLAQPTNLSQICTITNASGTMSGSNIQSISINCVTEFFTIGGSIGDFAGSGLVLQNNGGDNITINANGAYSFPAALVDGSSYAISILTQPTGTTATCSVINGAGLLSGANVSNVVISCKPLTSNYYFSANDGVNGIELWKTNGSAATTVLLKDINTAGNSNPGNFIEYNGATYFTANDGNGIEIWKTTGTEASTVKVTNIRPSTSDDAMSSYSFETIILNNKLFFTANDGVNGDELWSINSSDNATLEANINPGSAYSYPLWFVNYGGQLYFSATTASTGYELWRFDDNAGNATLVSDILTGTSYGQARSSSPTDLTVYNGKIYFRATRDIGGGLIDTELFVYDGVAGTRLFKEISPGTTSSNPSGFISTPLGLFFPASIDNTKGNEWHIVRSNGSESLLKSINTSTNNFYGLDGFAAGVYVNSTFYFPAFDGNYVQIWKTNGTNAGTTKVTTYTSLGTSVGEVRTFGDGSLGRNNEFVADTANGLIYFRTSTSIWVLDTQDDSVVKLMDNNANKLKLIDNSVYFSASDSLQGRELRRTEQTPESAITVKDINVGPASGL